MSAPVAEVRRDTAGGMAYIVPLVPPEELTHGLRLFGEQDVADIPFRLRVARLLAELHGEEVLSEQQCARYMGIDLVSWRRLERCFSAGTSFVEGECGEWPEDSESILKRALHIARAAITKAGQADTGSTT